MHEWDTSMQSRPDFTVAEMKKMKVSDETLEGLIEIHRYDHLHLYYGIKSLS